MRIIDVINQFIELCACVSSHHPLVAGTLYHIILLFVVELGLHEELEY